MTYFDALMRQHIVYKMLSKFRMIVAMDAERGIGKNGDIPWKNTEQSDLKYFRAKTLGHPIIMGRNTANSIGKILPGRQNIVVSTTFNNPGYTVYPTLRQALMASYDSIPYIIGGQRLYEEAYVQYGNLCEGIDYNIISNDSDMKWSCDTFFPLCIPLPYNKPVTWEEQYLNLMRKVLAEGNNRGDRTGTGTRSLFAPMSLDIDLRNGFPLLSTKLISWKILVSELLFFLSGETNSNILHRIGNTIWDGNTTETFLHNKGLSYPVFEMGPSYGFQWRHAGGTFNAGGQHESGVDQIRNLVTGLMQDPCSRRHILCAWNVPDIEKMCIPPCHALFQCYVGFEERDGKQIPTYLDGQLVQRSADLFLGVPYNIASYSLLLHILGRVTGLVPRRYSHVFGDVHIYNNHVDQCNELLSRSAVMPPYLSIDPAIINFEDLERLLEEFKGCANSSQFNTRILPKFKLENYNPWPHIRADMAV